MVMNDKNASYLPLGNGWPLSWEKRVDHKYIFVSVDSKYRHKIIINKDRMISDGGKIKIEMMATNQ